MVRLNMDKNYLIGTAGCTKYNLLKKYVYENIG
jgi:hypothetical protein